MHRDSEYVPELVSAARAGDARARERLVEDYLPLVYNVVGRALDGHADVDDVVQDTMFRALDGLDGLREPSRFRSWLVAIAMNQVRRRWNDRRQAPVASLDHVVERPDPAGDFVDLTILRLGLSGQRREVAEATRWLDEGDRALLSLWWQEVAGRLTRAELTEALGVSARHAAVRVQRMKARLETGRVVVRALAAKPRCGALTRLTADWDGRPAPVWRKRVARHVRGCRACGGHRVGLMPAEGLLAGLVLVAPLSGYPAVPAAGAGAGAAAVSASGAVPGGAAAGAPAVREGAAHGGGPGPGGPVGDAVHRWVPAAAGGALVGGALLAALWPVAPDAPVPVEKDRAPKGAAAPASPAGASGASRTPSPAASPAPTAPGGPAASAAPVPEASPSGRRTIGPSTAQRLTGLVNARRAEAGCAPLRLDPRLTAAARSHARDMVARRYFAHADPEGRQADARMSDAGYDAAAWAENLHLGPRDAAAVVADWMDGSYHERNMLGCRYRDTGVAAVPGPEGTVWVQILAGPA